MDDKLRQQIMAEVAKHEVELEYGYYEEVDIVCAKKGCPAGHYDYPEHIAQLVIELIEEHDRSAGKKK
jgi:hypothetical protein